VRGRLAAGVALAVLCAAAVRAAPAGAQAACRNAAIRSPFGGEVVEGAVPVLGSARIDDFNFYKVEWAREDDPESWSAVSSTMAEPVVNGLLDVWNTSRLPDGAYRLKLTVVDHQSQEVCKVTVSPLTLANDMTPTPTGTATTEATPTSAAEGPGSAGTQAPPAGEAGPIPAGSPEPTAPAPTIEPVIPLRGADAELDLLDPGAVFGALGIGAWLGAFAGGFGLALALALVALAVYALRRGP